MKGTDRTLSSTALSAPIGDAATFRFSQRDVSTGRQPTPHRSPRKNRAFDPHWLVLYDEDQYASADVHFARFMDAFIQDMRNRNVLANLGEKWKVRVEAFK